MKRNWKRLSAVFLTMALLLSMVIMPAGAAEAPPSGATIIDTSGAPASGTTYGQPFASGTGTSSYFRIPSLITVKGGEHAGRLVAAIDARWNQTGDGGNLDTIISYSDDGGATWHYSFPNYFNDSTDAKNTSATAFIDPVMVSDQNGRIYLLVDLFPGGVALNTAAYRPYASTGYAEIDGTQRMVLYTQNGDLGTAGGTNENQTDDNYAYYVGDFENGFAPVCTKDGGKSGYCVDEYYNLYDENQKKLYCQQLGSDAWVQQNVFFYNADLHVRATDYLWLTTSEDGGETWSTPTILNPQIRTGEDATYLTGPGAGLCLDDGTIMFPCYTFSNQLASFIYSTDGETWARSETATTTEHWSSESVLVQIDKNTVRQFYRDGRPNLYYTDHTRSNGKWTAGEPVDTGVPKTSNNQLSAIRYSKPVDGKPAILVSTAASGSSDRSNGKIYTLLLNNDNTMTLASAFSVTDGDYSYSSLTELDDGSIGLLYENASGYVTYENFPIGSVANGLLVEGKRVIHMPLYGTFVNTVSKAPTAEELSALDSSIVSVSVDGTTVTYTGLKDGTTSYTSDGASITVTVAPEQMTRVELLEGETQTIQVSGTTYKVEADPAIVETAITTRDDSADILGNIADGHGSFSSETISLTQVLFRFDAVEGKENTYIASAQTPDGETVYLNFANGDPDDYAIPTTTEQGEVVLTPFSWSEKEFSLKSGDNYLYLDYYDEYGCFWFVNNAEVYWDGCSFELYRPAQDGETSSEELPGFVQITNAGDIVSGESYLVVKSYYADDYYFLRPMNDGEPYDYSLRLSPIVIHLLTLTGKSAGTTDLMIGDMIYRVAVTNGTAVIEITDDEAKALVDEAVKSGSAEVVVKPEIEAPSKVNTVELTIPASMVDGIRAQAGMGLKLDTPVAQVSVPGSTLKEWGGQTVKVTASRQGDVLEFSIRSGDKELSGSVTVTAPVQDAGPGTVAVIVTEDGERVPVRKSIADPDAGTVIIPLDGSAKLELVDNSKTFADVSDGDWEADAVAFVSARGLFNGVNENTFASKTSMTRAMVAMVLHNLEYNPDAAASSGFPDTEGSWYTAAVDWAAEQKIIQGYQDGRFMPAKAVTREEFAVMLWRYAGQPKADGSASSKFTDADKIDSYAMDAMNWAVSNGILNGKGNDILDPTGIARRSEVAQMLMNFLYNVK